MRYPLILWPAVVYLAVILFLMACPWFACGIAAYYLFPHLLDGGGMSVVARGRGLSTENASLVIGFLAVLIASLPTQALVGAGRPRGWRLALASLLLALGAPLISSWLAMIVWGPAP